MNSVLKQVFRGVRVVGGCAAWGPTFAAKRSLVPAASLVGKQSRTFSTPAVPRSDTIKVTFATSQGESVECDGRIGSNLLDVAIENDIDIEGACGGTLACSTCHLYIDEDSFAKLPEIDEEEEDMLDLAFGLTDLSRLGCQCELTSDLDGIVCTLPDETSDIR